MDEEIERLVVSVRADTAMFKRDVDALRGELEGPLRDGVERAGRALENALIRAVRTGKLGFEDLKRVALQILADIAEAAIRSGIQDILKGGGPKGGIAGGLGHAIGGLFGLPGRASGRPVAPGRAYLVGERGPELLVPTSSGRVEPVRGGSARDIRLSITINAPAGTEPRALARSSRQVARAVKALLLRVED